MQTDILLNTIKKTNMAQINKETVLMAVDGFEEAVLNTLDDFIADPALKDAIEEEIQRLTAKIIMLKDEQ